MKIQIIKEYFIKVLELLENEGVIDCFEFVKLENVIWVYGENNNEAKFEFDNMDFLIDPRIRKYELELERLENKKQEILTTLKKLKG